MHVTLHTSFQGGKPGDTVQLVIPDALQMGWSESPPFFCAATKTARDVIQADMDTKSHVTKGLARNHKYMLLRSLL
jgi:hypothetical protein